MGSKWSGHAKQAKGTCGFTYLAADSSNPEQIGRWRDREKN